MESLMIKGKQVKGEMDIGRRVKKLKRQKILIFSTIGLILIGLFVVGMSKHFNFLNLWLTKDQQGRYYFEKGDYRSAAESFEDPFWKGVAYYRTEDYASAIDWFARLDTIKAQYNLANCYAQLGQYELALQNYNAVLDSLPGWSDAIENRALVDSLLKKPQKEEEAPPPGGPIFKADEIQFDDKGKKGKKGEIEMGKLSDKQLAEMWMRRLQSSPADFLKIKFGLQVEN
jgi:Ca-activated chloride channel homolog